jgi:hypothetical protein
MWATHDRLHHFTGERESTPSALVIGITTRSPTEGGSAKEGARQEGGGFEGVYVLDLSLQETSKSCGYRQQKGEQCLAWTRPSGD